MNDVQFKLNESKNGLFFIHTGESTIAEMVISIDGNRLTVYHTEVLPEVEGRGLAGELLKTMVAYARQYELKVVALCPYVQAQFQRHPDLYNDVWAK